MSTTTEKKKVLRQVRLADGKHQSDPTCDNCLWMTILKSGSGNHRHCDQMNLYIPDWEMFPTCSLHTRMNRMSRTIATHGGVRWETTIIKEGGAA